MLTTTRLGNLQSRTLSGSKNSSENTVAAAKTQPDAELCEAYSEIATGQRLSWNGHYHLRRLLGRGGQGEVYLTEVRGVDGFTVPVAMKTFCPDGFRDARGYTAAMQRVASVSARVAQIQHDNLLDVQNFFQRRGVRIMLMEWVDGYDLRQLVGPGLLDQLQHSVNERRWRYINDVIITRSRDQHGDGHSKFRPGIAMAIIREVLAGLAALHRESIVHGDVKPANIMLKRSGHAKLIDIGSAFDTKDPPPTRDCTPVYAAPEVLDRDTITPRSDLASVGYVLIELLSGKNPVGHVGHDVRALLQAKRELPSRLDEILPQDVLRNELLMNFVRGLISPDPNRRFPTAEDAEHVDQGAAAFQRQLVKGDMDTEYCNDIRVWLEDLRHLDVQIS
ncbi:MAG: serine/threonine-protein kinase [Planctomycetota bacterium]